MSLARPFIAVHSHSFSPRFQDYDAQDLEEFQESILRGCDFNKDGKISKKELTMVLLALAKQNDVEPSATK